MLLTGTTAPKQAGLESACVVPSAPPGNEIRPPVFSSAELLQGSREAWIEHGQQMYRLRLTSAGKLYLTK
jgi:hemin uptake protein HemP